MQSGLGAIAASREGLSYDLSMNKCVVGGSCVVVANCKPSKPASAVYEGTRSVTWDGGGRKQHQTTHFAYTLLLWSGSGVKFRQALRTLGFFRARLPSVEAQLLPQYQQQRMSAQRPHLLTLTCPHLQTDPGASSRRILRSGTAALTSAKQLTVSYSSLLEQK